MRLAAPPQAMGPPDFTLYCPGGDYRAALLGYVMAQGWVVSHELMFSSLGYGLIQVTYRGEPPPGNGIVPPELTDEPHWGCRLQFWFARELSSGELAGF